jgi:hypothetical protein
VSKLGNCSGLLFFQTLISLIKEEGCCFETSTCNLPLELDLSSKKKKSVGDAGFVVGPLGFEHRIAYASGVFSRTVLSVVCDVNTGEFFNVIKK